MKFRLGRFLFGLALIIILFVGFVYARGFTTDIVIVTAMILSIICMILSSLAEW